MKGLFFCGLLLLGMPACSNSNVTPALGECDNTINRETGFYISVDLSTERENSIRERICFTKTGRYFLSRSWNNDENYKFKTRSPEGLNFTVSLFENKMELESYTASLEPGYSSETASVVFNIEKRHLNKPLELVISANLPKSSDRAGKLGIGIYWYRPRFLQ